MPEEDAQLLEFLAECLLIPDHPVTIAEAAPYLGVMEVETQKNRVSIGYNVAKQIVVMSQAAANGTPREAVPE